MFCTKCGRLVLLLLLLAAGIAWGQEPVPAEAGASLAKLFQSQSGERLLPCEAQPAAPALTYRMLYSAGFVVDTPAAVQSELTVLVRITPEIAGAAPLLLRSVHQLPKEAAKNPKAQLEITGHYFLGPGEYQADLVLLDASQRVCRKHWKVVLKTPKAEPTQLGPGRLAAISDIQWPSPSARPGRLVVMIHAGARALNPALMESLAALVERIPVAEVQAVVFNLRQHKVLLRQRLSDAAAFERVQKTLDDFESQTVSYGALKDTTGHRDLLWKLLADQTRQPTPADAVFFLGVTTFDDRRVFAPPGCGQNKPRYAYFDFARPSSRRSFRIGPAPRRLEDWGRPNRSGSVPWEEASVPTARDTDLPDAITRVMKTCSGRIYHIHSPLEFADALEKAAEMVPAQEKP